MKGIKKTTASVAVGSLSKREVFISILIIGVLFFIFGFVSWVNAILIPYFKIAFDLSNFQSYLVTFAFYISYLVEEASSPGNSVINNPEYEKITN